MIYGTFLGTASIPIEERNSQGVLLDFNSINTILIDCGEGIQRQLLKVDTDLAKINTIFVTHNHIDHTYGVGGVLTLLLNRYPEKKMTIYAPSDTIKTVKELVTLFMPKNHSRIRYIKMNDEQKVETDTYSCFTFKTYHTESSLGYCFELENKKVALIGDVEVPNNHAREKIVRSIFGADIAVIDAVHITVEEATSIANDANIKELYLMPILLNETKEEVFGQALASFQNAYIPNDFQQFMVK